jgi:hypothetical protein
MTTTTRYPTPALTVERRVARAMRVAGSAFAPLASAIRAA